MALTKAIEKENTIEEMKEDLDRLLKKYEDLEDEKDKLNFNIEQYL